MSLSVVERRAMIGPQDLQLSVSRQCELVGLPRSSFYYQPVAPDAFTLEVMHAIDRIYTDRPFYGVRRIWKTLRDDGYLVNRKRVHRLMQLMGLQAIYPRKRLSLPDQAHRVFPYLQRPGPCVVRRHHVSALARRLRLPGSGDGLVQPLRALLARFQHPRRELLRDGAGGCPGARHAGHLQHRPGRTTSRCPHSSTASMPTSPSTTGSGRISRSTTTRPRRFTTNSVKCRQQGESQGQTEGTMEPAHPPNHTNSASVEIPYAGCTPGRRAAVLPHSHPRVSLISTTWLSR